MTATLSYFKALADETRLRIFYILSKYELNVNELVLILEMGQSRISRHLKILSLADLLVWRREGLWVFYSIPQAGEARTFINAVLPFMLNEDIFCRDLQMAAKMIEERAYQTRHFFNRIAEDWDKLSREILGDFDLPEAVVSRMPSCHVAADLGCGTGNVLVAMQQKADTVIGVDGSPRMLELARRRFENKDANISLRIGELSHLPLRDGEANVLSINMVLHHLPEPLAVLQEAWRALTADGLLILTDFVAHEDERMRIDYGDHWLGFEPATLQKRLEQAGFLVQKVDIVPLEQGLFLQIITAVRSAL